MVTQGEKITQAAMDALAVLANSKDISGKPYAFAAGGAWRAELSRLRAALWEKITLGSGYTAAGLVSGPWLLMRASSDPFILDNWQTAPLVARAAAACWPPWKESWGTKPFWWKDEEEIVADGAQIGSAAYLFGAGSGTKVQVRHRIQFVWQNAAFGLPIELYLGSLPTTAVGAPRIKNLPGHEVTPGNQVLISTTGPVTSHTIGGASAALVVSSEAVSFATDTGTGYGIRLQLDGEWEDDLIALDVTVNDGNSVTGWSGAIEWSWTHAEFLEAASVDADGVCSTGLKRLSITPLAVDVDSRIEISLVPTAGVLDGAFECLLAPVNDLKAEALIGLDEEGERDLAMPKERCTTKQGLVAWARRGGMESDGFVELTVTIPESVTGTATFDRANYNAAPASNDPEVESALNTTTCPYYKIALALSDRELITNIQTGSETAWQVPLRIWEGAKLVYRGDVYFSDARLTSADGEKFWHETVFYSRENIGWRFRHWFIAQEAGDFFLYLLLDERSAALNDDRLGFYQFSDDAVMQVGAETASNKPALVSRGGYVRRFYRSDNNEALIVKQIPSSFGAPYLPTDPVTTGQNRFSLWTAGGSVEYNWFNAKVKTECWPEEKITGATYARAWTESDWQSRRFPDYVPAWRVFPEGTPVAAWMIGKTSGGKWIAGTQLKLSISTRANYASLVDYKSKPMGVGWYRGAVSIYAGYEMPLHGPFGYLILGTNQWVLGQTVWEVQVNRQATRQQWIVPEADGTLKIGYEHARNLRLYYARLDFNFDDDELRDIHDIYLYKRGAWTLGAAAVAERNFYRDSTAGRVEVDPALYVFDSASGVIRPRVPVSDWPNPYDAEGGDYPVLLATYAVYADDLPQIKTAFGCQLDDLSFRQFAEVTVPEGEAQAARVFPRWPIMQPCAGVVYPDDRFAVLRANKPVLIAEEDYQLEQSAPVVLSVPSEDGRDHDVAVPLFTVTATQDMVLQFRGGWRSVLYETYSSIKSVDQAAADVASPDWLGGLEEGVPSSDGTYFYQDGPRNGSEDANPSLPWPEWHRRRTQYFAPDGRSYAVEMSGNFIRLTLDGVEPADGTVIRMHFDEFYVARIFVTRGTQTLPPRSTGGNHPYRRLFFCEVISAWQWFDVDVHARLVHSTPGVGAPVYGTPHAFHYNDTEAVLNNLS